MAKLTAKDLARFKITVSEANSFKITIDDLKGITEIIPNKKYRIVISNGFKKDGSRDRITETFDGTLLETIERKKEIKKNLEESNVNPTLNSKFEEFANYYCRYLEDKVQNKQLELTTYEGYYDLLQKRILPFFKNYILKDINEKDIEKWLNVLSKTKTQKGKLLHPTTIAHAYKLLHNMFNYAKLERVLRENPCEFVHKKPSEAPDEREYFTLEEMDYIKELLQTANIRLKTAIFLIMDTGCRREEIIGLKWEDVDLENNIIDINKAVVSTGKKTPISVSGAREKGVKSKHSNRRIGIPSVCADLLKQYRNFKKDSGLRVKDSDYIFTNWDNNRVWDPNHFTSEWCNFRKKHNITKNVPLHGIRHSNATFLLSTGMPDKDVAKRLGHTPEVLARVYTHSNEEDDKKLVAEIEKSFYRDAHKKQVQISTASIISVIAGYIDNQYKVDNYKLLDFLSSEKINNGNIDNFLKPCQEYLLSIYPVLDIFQNENVVPNEKVFNEKLENFVNFMGTEKTVVAPDEALSIIHKNL